MRPFLRDFTHNTSVMVAVVVLLMAAAAHIGHAGASVPLQADALSWASAVPQVATGQEVSVTIGGRAYVLTIRPQTAR